MEEVAPPSKRPANAIRWTGRVVGTLFVVMFLALFVLECVQKGRIAVDSGKLPMMIFLLLSFVGLIMAWKWEGAGGILALGSLLVFTILGLQSGEKPGGTILVLGMYGLPAFLFVLCWWQTRRQSHRTSKKPIAA